MAEPLVLLPGLMCDARLWTNQFLALNGERAIMVAPLTGAASIGALAQAVLDAAPRRFALAGLSLGGMVAMEVLARASDRVTRIALLDTSPLQETPQDAARREPRIIGAQNGRLEDVLREEVPSAALAPGPGRFEVTRTLVEMGRDMGGAAFASQSRAMQRRPDQQKTLRDCRVPALVLCGAHDVVFPVRRHETMAELIPGAVLKVIEDAGHLPPLEQPDATTGALREWLCAPLVLR